MNYETAKPLIKPGTVTPSFFYIDYIKEEIKNKNKKGWC